MKKNKVKNKENKIRIFILCKKSNFSFHISFRIFIFTINKKKQKKQKKKKIH